MVAEIQLVRGRALLNLGRPVEAITPLAASRAFLREIVGDQERADVAYSLAGAEAGLAAAYRLTGETDRARPHATAARAFYAGVAGYEPMEATL